MAWYIGSSPEPISSNNRLGLLAKGTVGSWGWERSSKGCMLLLVAYFSFSLFFFFSLFLASYEILLNQTCYDFFLASIQTSQTCPETKDWSTDGVSNEKLLSFIASTDCFCKAKCLFFFQKQWSGAKNWNLIRGWGVIWWVSNRS